MTSLASGGAQQLSPVCALVSERTGSSLSGHQISRLKEALGARLRGRSETEFARHLCTREGLADLAELMASVSVHKTDLFRDPLQLDAFVEHVLTPLARTNEPLRLWSAGCATGEEVATLLILLREAGAHPDSTVLGTDISDSALARARSFRFHAELLKRAPESIRERYFVRAGAQFELVPELQARSHFRVHNLMDTPYPTPVASSAEGFDVIFCRNVLIYFTETAFDFTVRMLARSLVKGGTLVLSAAEPILRPQPDLEPLRCERAFFYVRKQSAPLPLGEGKGEGLQFKPSGPPAGSAPIAERAQSSKHSRPEEEDDDPLAQATELFHRVMEDAADGEDAAITEKGLRSCLYLDPHHAQARYLLGVLLEQRGDLTGAATEFRRALKALEEGRSRQAAFFLNDERLKSACSAAIRRLETHSLATR